MEQYGELLSVGGGKERMTAHWNGKPATLNVLDIQSSEGVNNTFISIVAGEVVRCREGPNIGTVLQTLL